MKHILIKSFAALIFISLLSLDVSAVGLQEYLQNGSTTGNVTQTTAAPTTSITAPVNDQFTNIIELVVAGIVGSALIISILVLFLGRWAGRKEKNIIQKLRVTAEKEKNHITAAVTTVREYEKETSKLTSDIKQHTATLSAQKKVVDHYTQEIVNSSDSIKSQEQELNQVSSNVSSSMEKIQTYWDAQLRETVSTIHKVQGGLESNLSKVDKDLEVIQRQKGLTQELLEDFLGRHNEQNELIHKNTTASAQVAESLEETLHESNLLVKLLKQHQQQAEDALKQFTEELTHYEEQAYEQFDSSFQVADLARQELTANVDESRKHIETMRRHEEQSHNINTQTHKNLEALDFSKITKLSNTLDSTQDMFSDIHTKVEDAKHLLDELKDIETDIRETAVNVKNTASNDIVKGSSSTDALFVDNQDQSMTASKENVYKLASGDNTPLSFFNNIRDKD